MFCRICVFCKKDSFISYQGQYYKTALHVEVLKNKELFSDFLQAIFSQRYCSWFIAVCCALLCNRGLLLLAKDGRTDVSPPFFLYL